MFSAPQSRRTRKYLPGWISEFASFLVSAQGPVHGGSSLSTQSHSLPCVLPFSTRECTAILYIIVHQAEEGKGMRGKVPPPHPSHLFIRPQFPAGQAAHALTCSRGCITFLVLLPLPPMCWSCRCAPPCSVKTYLKFSLQIRGSSSTIMPDTDAKTLG